MHAASCLKSWVFKKNGKKDSKAFSAPFCPPLAKGPIDSDMPSKINLASLDS